MKIFLATCLACFPFWLYAADKVQQKSLRKQPNYVQQADPFDATLCAVADVVEVTDSYSAVPDTLQTYAYSEFYVDTDNSGTSPPSIATVMMVYWYNVSARAWQLQNTNCGNTYLGCSTRTNVSISCNFTPLKYGNYLVFVYVSSGLCGQPQTGITAWNYEFTYSASM
jgi:hypothetical protein